MSAPRLSDIVRAGMRVAFGDGAGAPVSLAAALTEAAAHADISLFLGWMPAVIPGLDFGAFTDVRCVIPAAGVRRAVNAGEVRSLPVPMSGVPNLVRGVLRPDVLLATVVRTESGYRFGSEVSWMRAAVDAGATVVAVCSRASPHCDAGPPLPPDQVVIVGEVDAGPAAIPSGGVSPVAEAITRHAADLVPEGARVQVGVGQLGNSFLRAVRRPVRIDSGLIPDEIVGLDERGLLIGEPVGAYLAGSARLYEWAHGRPILRPVEFTHDVGRLAADPPLFAFNTAVEIDLAGQVNVEGTERSVVGGVGGHADFCAAAARSAGGLSVIGVPSEFGGRSSLVPWLSRPASTPSHDVDIVVTERGVADLRGMDRVERTAALRELWGAVGVRPVDP